MTCRGQGADAPWGLVSTMAVAAYIIHFTGPSTRLHLPPHVPLLPHSRYINMGLDLLSFMRPVRQHFNRRLSFCVCMLMCCSANFAFDNKAFSQTQAMPQFTRRFGDYNRATGKYKLEATYLALFNCASLTI